MNKSTIVLDYNCGNILSISNAIKFLGGSVSYEMKNLKPSSILVIPGVGHFESAMTSIVESGYVKLIKSHVSYGGKVLGICLGMQLLFSESSESKNGYCKGLDLVRGRVDKLPANLDQNLSINLGWKEVVDINSHKKSMYFVHQYYCQPDDMSIATHFCNWNGFQFTAGLQHQNIYAFQFHPEKSSEIGLNLLQDVIH